MGVAMMDFACGLSPAFPLTAAGGGFNASRGMDRSQCTIAEGVTDEARCLRSIPAVLRTAFFSVDMTRPTDG
jgi:hypothetical protein